MLVSPNMGIGVLMGCVLLVIAQTVQGANRAWFYGSERVILSIVVLSSDLAIRWQVFRGEGCLQ